MALPVSPCSPMYTTGRALSGGVVSSPSAATVFNASRRASARGVVMMSAYEKRLYCCVGLKVMPLRQIPLQQHHHGGHAG
jgi:hypothetical protein